MVLSTLHKGLDKEVSKTLYINHIMAFHINSRILPTSHNAFETTQTRFSNHSFYVDPRCLQINGPRLTRQPIPHSHIPDPLASLPRRVGGRPAYITQSPTQKHRYVTSQSVAPRRRQKATSQSSQASVPMTLLPRSADT